ncbi:MAG TPA: hypothetical protein VGX23_22130 [Actinocrinis sp.]|nr:hypothetical protein [Actinocrinis sp.]
MLATLFHCTLSAKRSPMPTDRSLPTWMFEGAIGSISIRIWHYKIRAVPMGPSLDENNPSPG